ncbi:MAG: glutathione S-transferase N-terminal domain-containing protein [Planktothrix sp. GU0601_MAG3]|nr:MAG: glutathione S-transferase N-terminal domain-containing protein [Planktothrix sp. GU0601_MAG3]
MIELHYWPTPNGHKISIFLEETGLDYQIIPINIGTGAQFKPEFLKIAPNNRMPAIIDFDPVDGGEPLSIFESGAILIYLAEKTGQFFPENWRDRKTVLASSRRSPTTDPIGQRGMNCGQGLSETIRLILILDISSQG